jgi:hypothetical protein
MALTDRVSSFSPDYLSARAQARNVDAQAQLGRDQLSLERQQFQSQERIRNQLLSLLGLGSGGQGLFGGQPGSPGVVGGPEASTLLGQLTGFGAGERSRIEQGFQTAGNNALAHLQSRGLASSTIVPSIMGGLEREKQQALGSLEDRLLGERIGIQERAAGRQLQSTQLLASLIGGLV